MEDVTLQKQTETHILYTYDTWHIYMYRTEHLNMRSETQQVCTRYFVLYSMLIHVRTPFYFFFRGKLCCLLRWRLDV